MKTKDTARRDTFARLEQRKEWSILPPATDYAALLQIACEKERISKEEARSKYGLCTYKNWYALLRSNGRTCTKKKQEIQ